MDVTGTWLLDTWRRYGSDGSISHPFGEHPEGILVHTPDGYMALQMLEVDRPNRDTDDALGGTEAERAQAYSTCLASGATRWTPTRSPTRSTAACFPTGRIQIRFGHSAAAAAC